MGTEVSSPTWTLTSTRPSPGQVILSSLPHTSPTKLVTNRQSPVSPRSNTVQIQLPSPGLQLHRGGQQPPQSISPEKLLILMSPNKEGAASVSPTKEHGGLVVSPAKGLIMPQGRILLQGGGTEAGGLVLSPTKTPTLQLPSPTKTTSGQVSPAAAAVSPPVTTTTNLS